MTPKSLLRHKKAVSNLADMAEGSSFHRVMIDGAEAGCDVGGIKLKSDDKITRVIACSGKVYYDLIDARAKAGRDDVYIVRLEQFYPWPLKSVLGRAGPLQERRTGLVPGRAQEHGRLDLRRSVAGADAGQADVKAKRARYVGRPGLGLHGRRHDEPPPERTRDLPERSLRLIASNRRT
jgi:2-oxoglutarate dehydrogenase E1 component